MTYGTPIQFVGRESGETLNGHLMPEDERAIADITEELRRQFARLGPGQWFEAKFGRDQAGRISPRSVAIKPPQIFPVKG